MKDSRKERRFDIKLIVLNIVIIIMAFLLMLSVGYLIEEIHYVVSDYMYDEYSFVYALEDEDYGRIVYMYNENYQNDYADESKLQEYYGIAKYYEAAFDFKVYEDLGEAGKAQEKQHLMDEAQLQMGELAFVADRIDERMGIKE